MASNRYRRPQRIEPRDLTWDDDAATSSRPNRGLLGGCGFFVVVIALLAIIGLVGYLVAGFVTSNNNAESDRQPVPTDVPPKAASPAPDIDGDDFDSAYQRLLDWAKPKSEELNIPLPALIAYGNAEAIARAEHPTCNLSWNTLAGLGYVETRHGTYDGDRFGASKLNDDGIAEPDIIGPKLDGRQFAKVEDTDGGRLDRDREYDRALGPMQFIPESWKTYGVDADKDGKKNPQSVFDAAAAASALLCREQRDLGTKSGWTNAIKGYNLSDEYVMQVRDAAANYALGQSPM
ncbi:lytic murein transglycosylase [uncultured Corynebacterium sp.]|uniref:lytic transglycosylase domain-containing protein n=1 Tax=uncultured Corynebacterium sp. TaxID=159447 RepID=UPI0025EA8C8B|nr:lytic murein transglycosylase [uncultured Corynebacterium sp.]